MNSFFNIANLKRELSPETFDYFFPGWKEEPTSVRFSTCASPKQVPAPKKKETVKRKAKRKLDVIWGKLSDTEIHLPEVFYNQVVDDYEEVKPKLVVPVDIPVNNKLSDGAKACLDEFRALMAKYGMTLADLETLIREGTTPSRLVVTAKFKIFLKDYDNKEVVLNPLAKAVFLLYLQHPEGLRFKDLCDYRDELERIYFKISNSSDLEKMRASIDRLVSPVDDNSINEKVSKIKKAFCDVVDERIAQMYFIDGPAGGIKGIPLDRSLLVVEK